MRARFGCSAVLSAVALTVAGCHRKTTVAYQPPPPPPASSSTGANRSGGVARSDSGNGSTAVVPSPAPVPNSYGRPVSSETGLASWYGPPYAGRKGADGTVYDQNAMTAAHLTLPMGTMVRVTNLTTNQSVVVKITDRGPFVRGRIIDLSLAAAKATGVYRAGRGEGESGGVCCAGSSECRSRGTMVRADWGVCTRVRCGEAEGGSAAALCDRQGD